MPQVFQIQYPLYTQMCVMPQYHHVYMVAFAITYQGGTELNL